jgi:CheY-like chemotaxis protein/HPt (histidine-containing phosphotransfer) domain-containing protein
VFEVADTGIGLTGEQIKKLFGAYEQADPSTARKFGGTGLGLSIALRLAKLLGGDVRVESLVGRGSSFTLSVETGPLAGVPMLTNLREAGVQLEVGKAGPAPIRLTAHVLLAEDGTDNQILVSTHLRRAGAEVQIAENGRIALDLALAAERAGKAFDVILMDMQMPEMDGYTATRRLRKDGYKGPIVALTAHAMEGDRAQCIAAGCDDYLTKPIDRPMLLATVERYAQASMGRGDTLLAPSQFVRTSDAPLVSELADDPDVADIVDGFARAARARADALLKALGDDDAPTMQRLVHQLKGAAGGYGFPSITEQARNVEAAFAGGDTERLAAEVQALSRLCYRAGRAAVAGHAESLRESAA